MNATATGCALSEPACSVKFKTQSPLVGRSARKRNEPYSKDGSKNAGRDAPSRLTLASLTVCFGLQKWL